MRQRLSIYPSVKSQLESEAVFADLFHDLENLVRPTRFPTWKGLDALADIAGFYPALDISLQFAPPEICCNAIGSLLHTKVATDKRVVTELENNFPHVVRLVSCMLDCFVRCWLTLRSL
ncbi:Hypothetical predicted protein [Cloeon dipterum]|uniref:Uncharacterized protein n=1 Tax=Cloeon dipterum TaxID=197152 RepID=A0A8S1CHM5_9INSE|nr:Hypothetical predicted protein [Cloeon dipterum]